MPRVPRELLGLLPRELPPWLAAATWPEGFSLEGMLSLVDGGGEVRVEATYPEWRRATRLSFALAHVLGQIYGAGGFGGRVEAVDKEEVLSVEALLQEVLEAVSTSERLRLVLRRLRDARNGAGL